eukprot:gb/GFBE01036907.1/.p1 GENE.gb/GFBE01036907.1/~~gb/GFBE01036907.1/.p1  ORF type:complete len:335 (+),score=77.51 gb/GFBE01036907.1/:1-1005(+)
MQGTQQGSVECRLDSANDLAALLAALTLREKDAKDQRVLCEASENGLKFTAQSNGKDVAVLGWIFKEAFAQWTFHSADDENIHLKLPVAPLTSCLTIFSDRAALVLRYPSGGANELRFSLEEDGATTECRLRTLVLDEAPVPINAFLAPGERPSAFRARQPEAWYLALSEFVELDAPDVVLRVTLRTVSAMAPDAPAVVLRARTINSDAEVELPQSSLEELELDQRSAAAGEVTHCYLLSSVLAGCLKAAKDCKAVKVRFNQDGVMSNQFIMKGRGRQLLCEALVCPIADVEASIAGAGLARPAVATQPASGGAVGGNPYFGSQTIAADESIGF